MYLCTRIYVKEKNGKISHFWFFASFDDDEATAFDMQLKYKLK